MCDRCQQFATTITIKSPKEFKTQHNRLFFDGVKPGVLEIIDGSLQWDDYVECTLRCMFCQQLFKLACETYHGIGGRFGPTQ